MQMVKQTTRLGETLASRLTEALQAHNRVVWLVPGGSNIPISIKAMALIDEELTKKLVIMQTDERFVPVDDPDCNWLQLRNGGFDTKYAVTFPFLVGGESREQTVVRYSKTIQDEFASAEYILGQFGFGTDGHIAGIKPHSVASTSSQLVSGYQAEDFMRVTLTFEALRYLDEAITFGFGESKLPILTRLISGSPPLEGFPVGILNHIANSTLYNDQLDQPEGTQ